MNIIGTKQHQTEIHANVRLACFDLQEALMVTKPNRSHFEDKSEWTTEMEIWVQKLAAAKRIAEDEKRFTE